MSFSSPMKPFSILLLLLFYILNFFVFSSNGATSSFIHYNCTKLETFSPNSTYKFNQKKLFSSLSTKSSDITNHGFYNTTIGEKETIYGLFMCIGYTNHCEQCVKNSTKTLSSKCGFNKEAIIWSDECLVRYSNQSFFNTIEELPSWCVQETQDYEGLLSSFNKVKSSLMDDLLIQANDAPISSNKFVFKSSIFYEDRFLFGLAQCTPNLSKDNCNKCLKDAMDYLHNSCASVKTGASVLFPSCIVRYGPYPFFLLPRGKRKKSGGTLASIIFHGVIPVMIFAFVVFIFGWYLLRRRARKNLKYHYQKENFGEDNITTEINSLQFDFDMIRIATNKFSDDNKIGEGGFGDVYKGTLPNGDEIAVKRLIRNSSQGSVEFKNEVLLIAKLQHRNLVRLLGFCLERNEKLLIYEFMHNKSLDYYLFSTGNHRKITWPERYKIVRGIARGILYLHEDSHLKVIHCDLKPSNILLDDKMNAKISDFGLARIVAIDQMQGNTSIIAGTYGYMSPEYAMFGQFSVKSDVFSFGVIILEIVSGKRNVDFNGVNSTDDLLSHAWKKWRDYKQLELLDPTLAHSFSETEVNRCIQIGLLCVQENPDQRPTMATIALYFHCYSIDLPLPLVPAFYMRGRTESRVANKESVSGGRPRSYSVARF